MKGDEKDEREDIMGIFYNFNLLGSALNSLGTKSVMEVRKKFYFGPKNQKKINCG